MDTQKFISELKGLGLTNADNKYGRKLDFDQRCEILALWRTGQVSRMALGKAYGIDRRTVAHIYTEDSVHYRDVRAEEVRLGREGFMAKYLTENAMAKLKALPKKKQKIVPNDRHASSQAGFHNIKERQFQIGWVDGTERLGWYFREVLDVTTNRTSGWLHNGEQSRTTSTACLKALKESIAE